MPTKEPRNPFYLLLLVASVLFSVTAIAYGIIPWLETQAEEMGQIVPPSAFRDALRRSGWKWLAAELAAMTLFGVLSMVVDRIRGAKEELETSQPSPGGKSGPGA